ncbi:hypothetical protein ETB97_000470 [Aspergillus alliaceus]|uniref:Uncharacterized protein n=1 Tax=Petromyces alliaceus TaxID=209559 RepID=A0A8H6A7E2_PETAA|nr:hypothetical protein ETB97_000470 [Aspergillus burnettii]
MALSVLSAEQFTHAQRATTLKLFRNCPHLPGNEVIDLNVRGVELGYAGCDTPQKLWGSLSQTNAAGHGDTYGRIISIRSLSQENVLTIASCLRGHFNIQELFEDFLARSPSQFKIPYSIRSVRESYPVWCWTIKLYGLGSSKAPMFPLTPQKDYGRFPARSDIVLYRSSTIIALSFDQNQDDHDGGPWRVLVLATGKYYRKRTKISLRASGTYSGYESFLLILFNELTDSRRKMRVVYEQIMEMTKPKESILFDEAIRDDLLFEDSTFSLSKNYFWALKTIEILNGSIESLLERWQAYKQFPLLRHDSESQGAAEADDFMSSLPEELHQAVHLIEEEMEKFREMIKLNERRRNEIRTQLQERIISEGSKDGSHTRPISTAFLPIMLVTSIFSMSVLPNSADLDTLAITMPAVCVPVYICALILTGDLDVTKIKCFMPSASRYLDWMKSMSDVKIAEISYTCVSPIITDIWPVSQSSWHPTLDG